MRKQKCKEAARAGFSLAEVLIATVIFSIVVIGTGSMTVAARKHVLEIGMRRNAMATANNLMERLEAVPASYMGYDGQSYDSTSYYELNSSSTGISVFNSAHAYNLPAINGRVFTTALAGTKRKGTTPDGLDYDYMDLGVTVAWGASSNQMFRISAVRSELSK